TGLPGARGNNSYWTRTYGSGAYGGAWIKGQPSNPTFGVTCSFSQCFQAAWDATNRWNGNAEAAKGGAGIAIMQDSDFNVEVPSILPPAGRAGGGSGAFDGK